MVETPVNVGASDEGHVDYGSFRTLTAGDAG